MNPYYQNTLTTLYQGDCLEVMPQPEGVFDAIICDLPYGVTACKWDSVIPLGKLWECYKRLIKPNGAIVLFGSQPFTSELVMSNREWFRYEIVWEKTIGNNFLMCKRQPLRKHETISVFYDQQCTYSPQMETGKPYIDKPRRRSHRVIDSTIPNLGIVNDGTRFPGSVLKFANPNNSGEHPTQKPIALLDYLIRTYTNKGDRILDNTCGSGTALLAAQLAGRYSVGIEQDPEYCDITVKRLQEVTTRQDVKVNNSKVETVQPMLFTLSG